MIATMKLSLVFLFTIIISSCTPKKQQQQLVNEQSNAVGKEYNRVQINLIEDAQQATRNWESYQKFKTELENYDHSKAATTRLIDHAASMYTSVPSPLVEQPILSRLVVLQTRLGIYAAALRNKSMPKATRIKKYNDMILAIDQLHMQLNEKLGFQQNIDNLYQQLKTKYTVPVDSLAVPE